MEEKPFGCTEEEWDPVFSFIGNVCCFDKSLANGK
jgi:hypothetical protein